MRRFSGYTASSHALAAIRAAPVAVASGLALLLCQALAHGDDTGAKKVITRIQPAVTLSGFQPLTAFAAPGKPVPAAASHEVYKGSGGLQVGIWEGEAGTLQLKEYPVDEYCVLVSGELVITSAGGAPQTFRAGDSFVIPKGFSGTWEMKSRVRKQSVRIAAPSTAR